MAKVNKISAHYGVSAELNGQWHKFAFTMEVELNEKDDVKKSKEKLWNTVHDEVYSQVESLLKE